MPAQVFGELREDKATYGEKLTLGFLKSNLPDDFSIYVECPLHEDRAVKFPDFVVLTNYGVVVLEVKDWLTIESCDKYGGTIITRQNSKRHVTNPVKSARDYAITLQNNLQENQKKMGAQQNIKIPWGYAAVLPNIGTAVKTQIWNAWGEEFIWNKDDLSHPDLLKNKLKKTISTDHIRALSKSEIDFVRSTINPTVLIENTSSGPIILDQVQEKLIVEPIKKVETPAEKDAEENPQVHQFTFLEEKPADALTTAKVEALPQAGEDIIRNDSVRLVRGVAGSGKTLVLVQRAKYLASNYPEWKILVLAYNSELSSNLQSRIKGFNNIKIRTFHQLCSSLLKYAVTMPKNIQDDAEGWLYRIKTTSEIENPILDELPVDFLTDEIQWIKEIGINNREEYLQIQRKGRGDQRILSPRMRNQIYDLLESYAESLKAQHNCDWADVAKLTLNAIQTQKITPDKYDVIIIDEAQDFAPIWLKIIKEMLKRDGLLFMADDPAQSIFRYYSWKERGIPVVGRTRRLQIPYRNTYEIYRAAFAIIEQDETLQKSLEEEKELSVPDMESDLMRHGDLPLVQRFSSLNEEIETIQVKIHGLIQNGVAPEQIAVMSRKKSDVNLIQNALKISGIKVETFHKLKGLEFHTVFITQAQEAFDETLNDPQKISVERRLFYMVMTRARQQLYIGYKGKLPARLDCLQEYVDFI